MKITRYTNIALFKTKDAPSEANQNKPYFEMSAKENKESTTKVYPAKFWFKKSESGVNYFSGSMAEVRTYEGKDYEGYVIVSVKELDALEASINKPIEGKGIDMSEFTGAVKNTEDIPF